MNIHLSVDDRVAEEAGKVARAMGKSLEQAASEYLERLAAGTQIEAELKSFERSALGSPGRLGGSRINRDEANLRAMPVKERFELRRLSDDLIYRFRRAVRADGTVGYRREDLDLWIIRSTAYGWVAVDETTGAITGRPWESQAHEEADFPPEGEWVSKKGVKSYVYRLKYID